MKDLTYKFKGTRMFHLVTPEEKIVKLNVTKSEAKTLFKYFTDLGFEQCGFAEYISF